MTRLLGGSFIELMWDGLGRPLQTDPRGAGARAAGARAADGGRDEGDPDRRSVLRPQLDLRAEARRDSLHRDPRRRRGTAAFAQRPQREHNVIQSLSRPSPRRAASSSPSTGRWSRSRGPRPDFSRLVERQQHWVPVYLYVFDVLWLEGHDVRGLPLRTRKRLLRSALEFHGNVRWTQYRNRDGAELVQGGVPQGVGGADRQASGQPIRRRRGRRIG